jgi:hypothetical protein
MINKENTQANSGGPANPIGDNEGMTLRDFFAAYIAQGIYAANTSGYAADMQAIAELSFAQADYLVNLRDTAVVAPYAAPFIIPEPPPVPPEPVVEQPIIEVTRV